MRDEHLEERGQITALKKPNLLWITYTQASQSTGFNTQYRHSREEKSKHEGTKCTRRPATVRYRSARHGASSYLTASLHHLLSPLQLSQLWCAKWFEIKDFRETDSDFFTFSFFFFYLITFQYTSVINESRNKNKILQNKKIKKWKAKQDLCLDTRK